VRPQGVYRSTRACERVFQQPAKFPFADHWLTAILQDRTQCVTYEYMNMKGNCIMSIKIGETAPDFDVDTTNGQINFHAWIGDSWAFFFSHPADYTPVCTTEMGRTAQLAEEFAKRNTKPIGLSTDTVEEHKAWILDVNDTQHTTLTFPIVADPDLRIAKLYGMIHPQQSSTEAVRAVFIIDPQKKGAFDNDLSHVCGAQLR
jgi:alkyl hydroperoxide reductase subunit AhpC